MKLLSYFSIRLPIYLTYMIQQVEYQPDKFIAWLRRRPDLFTIMHRQVLVMSAKARALVVFQYLLTMAYMIIVGILCSALSPACLLLVLLIPPLNIAGLLSAVYAGRLISLPVNNLRIKKAGKIFESHPGLKIAILGSYGKTTMKELLLSILSEGKQVSATPGNQNVPISHARWASRLNGREDVLLIELGEAEPGDIAAFCKNVHPDIAVVTGLAPNHLDRYGSLDNVAEDLASVGDFVDLDKIFVNTDSEKLFAAGKLNRRKTRNYSQDGTSKVRIKEVKLDAKGMAFSAVIDDKQTMKFQTKLVGRHLLGPLSACIELALQLGLGEKEISRGIRNTRPFPHRLEPREIGGAWLIDDTYNGSLEGFHAGLNLLSELKAKRKIYVTPGLVDQGEETGPVHREIGAAIAQAAPEKVVLMKNSTTAYIESSLKQNGFRGQLEIRDDPLEFYSNIEHYLAKGDLWLLQNDWPDAYQ